MMIGGVFSSIYCPRRYPVKLPQNSGYQMNDNGHRKISDGNGER